MSFVSTRPSTFKILIKEGKEIEPNSIFITGFHGLGEVGYLSVAHLIRSLEAERIGFIKSDVMPLFVSVENGHISLPFELFKYKNFVFLVPRFQPHQAEQWNFIDELATWLSDMKFKDIILIGGLDINFREDEEETMRGVPTSAAKEKLEKWGIPLLEEGLFVAGPLALLLAHLEIREMSAIGLLSYAQRGRPDPKAAATTLEKINKMFDINIDVTQLLDESKEIEKIEKMKRHYEGGSKPSNMYV